MSHSEALYPQSLVVFSMALQKRVNKQVPILYFGFRA